MSRGRPEVLRRPEQGWSSLLLLLGMLVLLAALVALSRLGFADWEHREADIMGTRITVELFHADPLIAAQAIEAVMQEMHRIDATMSPYEIVYAGGSVEHWNEEPGAVWIKRLLNAYPKAIWLNPEPEQRWEYTPSVKMTRELMEERMYPLTLAGIDDGMGSSGAGDKYEYKNEKNF